MIANSWCWLFKFLRNLREFFAMGNQVWVSKTFKFEFGIISGLLKILKTILTVIKSPGVQNTTNLSSIKVLTTPNQWIMRNPFSSCFEPDWKLRLDWKVFGHKLMFGKFDSITQQILWALIQETSKSFLK